MSEVWFFRGLVLKQLGEYDQASESFQNASRLYPENEMYSAYLKKYSGINQDKVGSDEKKFPFEYRIVQITIPIIILLGSWLFGFFVMRKKFK